MLKTKRVFDNIITGIQDIQEQLENVLTKEMITNIKRYRTKNMYIMSDDSDEVKKSKETALLITISKENKFIQELFNKKIGKDFKQIVIKYLENKLSKEYDKIKVSEYMNELEEVF